MSAANDLFAEGHYRGYPRYMSYTEALASALCNALGHGVTGERETAAPWSCRNPECQRRARYIRSGETYLDHEVWKYVEKTAA